MCRVQKYHMITTISIIVVTITAITSHFTLFWQRLVQVQSSDLLMHGKTDTSSYKEYFC